MTRIGLGTGGGWTSPDRVVVHFGSSEGTQYGSDDNKVVQEFVRNHPEFILDDKEPS